MSDHEFRNPDLVEQRHERDFIRKHCPNASDGFVAEDLDLLLRVYGPNYGTDAVGKFRLVEIKYGNPPLGKSKENTFGAIDAALRVGLGDRYEGYFYVRTDAVRWDNATTFKVNSATLNTNEFIDWLNGDLPIAPRTFKGPKP